MDEWQLSEKDRFVKILTMKTLKQYGLTPKKIELLDKLNIHTAEELLSYYPFRYEEVRAVPFSEWRVKDKVVFEGRIITPVKTNRITKGRTITRFEVETDETDLQITIFNRPWARQLNIGDVITITGKYDGYDKVTALNYNNKPLKDQLGINPIYNLKEGITQKHITDAIRKVMEHAEDIEDVVPASFIDRYRLLPKKVSLRFIHFPRNHQEIEAAFRSLKYEEFLKFHLAIQYIRSKEILRYHKKPKAFSFDDVYALAIAQPFQLTADQVKATNDILADLSSDSMMYRLIQGDVGCGKTMVASLAMYANCLAGYQSALLAPTEILAKQHYFSLKKLFRPCDLKIEVLYSALSQAKKNDILTALKNGEIDILIGTHALLQPDVEFHNLGLVIADEQQRFGVDQRRALRNKGNNVDFLLMSATPIPRTLANTLYGDMDISTIETMPAGRKGVETHYIHKNSIVPIIPELVRLLKEGKQIYVICAAIEENENYDARNVIDVRDKLSEVFKDYKVDALHGRMSSEEKEEKMDAFNRHQSDILVSTTVVEVGVNVVNATCIVIYDAHRFGMSQIHQLRGRVQRGSEKGYCYLLSDTDEPESMERLNVLERTSNGFEISQEDLRLRGPGDILGTRQSGVPGFILGNLVEDTRIINQAKLDAIEMMKNPNNPEYEPMMKLIIALNQDNATYID